MFARRLLRLSLSLLIGLIALAAISAALHPTAQAATLTVRVYPDVAPCNTTLQACLDASADGDVIQIKPGTYTTSVTLDKPVSLIGLGTITPTTLFAPLNQRVMTITGAVITASAVISNLHLTGGQLTGADCASGACGGAILLTGTARPTLARLSIDNNSAYQGGGLWADVGPEIVIVDSKIVSNSAAHAGGGLYASADVRLVNTLIERNTSNDNGGGLDVSGALNMTSSAFLSNTASNGGGGARVALTATLNSGRWEGNTTNGFGGGLFASNLIMTGTLFINNQGYGYGGGAYINGPALTQDGRFERNRASGFSGGGLYADSLRANGTQFISNTTTGSTVSGGGAYVSGWADLNLVRLEGNFSGSSGGGLYAGGPVTLTNATLINNLADMGSGGGVYAGSGLALKGSRLENNVSRSGGGGAYTGGPAMVADTVFVSNSASLRGGGLAASAGVDAQRSQFLRNTGAQSGGGLDVEGPLGVTNSLFISNTASLGGGVYHNRIGDGRVVNSLFARNTASATSGGALHLASPGRVDVIHTTIADSSQVTATVNPAAAIWNGMSSLYVTDTLIADHATGIYNSTNGSGTAQEDYNLFARVSVITFNVTSGGHSLNPATPQFIDPANDNYHLRLGAAAIDHGTDAGVHFDIDGQPRPIGPGFDIGFDEAFTSIQQAIDSAPDGGTVFIPPGVYTESLTLARPVSLIGVGPLPPVIHAAPNQRVITITGAAITRSTVISNLGLTGGNVSIPCALDCFGAGLLITDQARPQLTDLDVYDNYAVMGGGLYVQTGGARLVNVQLRRNRAAQSGGGLYIEQPGVVVEHYGGSVADNLAVDGAGVFAQAGVYRPSSLPISNNRATNRGGGIIVGGTGQAVLNSVTVYSNSAVSGGGLFIDQGGVQIISGTIAGNTADWGGGVYLLQPSATFTLTGGSIDSNRVVTAGGGLLVEAGVVYLNGGVVQGNRAQTGGGVFVDHGQFNFNSGSIYSNSSTYGGGVYLLQPGAAFTQTGGTLGSNQAVAGGGYYLNAGRVVLTGGAVVSNRAANGAGLYINSGQGQLQGTALISGNVASAFGGGAYLSSPGATLTQLGGSIQSNTAPDGGGVKITDGQFTLWVGQVSQNAATGFGGGVLLYSAGANFTQRGGVVANNTAQSGGGVYVLSGTTTIGVGARIDGNTATGLGGGLYLADGAVTLNGDVTNNRAQSGGGLYVETGGAAISGGQIISNTAEAYGGGIVVDRLGDVNLGGLWRVAGNTANGMPGGGGLFVQMGGQATLLSGRMEGNTAVGYGGGLYAASGFVVKGTRFFNNVATTGGAIYHTGAGPGRIVNVFVAGNANGASVSLNSTGVVSVDYATFGNAATLTGRAIEVSAGDVRIVNSIVASYSIGISHTAGTVFEDYNLFFGTPLSLTGVISSGGHSRAGFDPQFVNPQLFDYHLRPTSPAINRALDVGVRRDIDFDARPIGGGYDIGADELQGAGATIPPGLITTTTVLSYTAPNGGSASVFIPPGAISGSISNTVSFYYTVISADSITASLPSRLALSGDLFELDAFIGDEENATPIVTFNAPVTITLHYTETDLNGISEQTLKLYRLEVPPFGAGWCVLGVCRPDESQTLDTVNNIITATVTGFSKWGRAGAQYAYELFLPVLLKDVGQ